MYRRLMVPLDGTVESQHAIPIALSIAARAHAVVELVHVALLPSLAAQVGTAGLELYSGVTIDPQVDRAVHDASARHLAALAARTARTAVHVETTVLDRSDIVNAIAEHAEQSKPDLLAMTKHDHSWIERLVLGSVSESVVRRVSMPVLMVPGASTEPSLERHVSIDHILVALDGSALGAAILPHVRMLASTMDARVTLFTVSDETTAPPPPALASLELDVDSSIASRNAMLARVAAEFRAAGLTTETKAVVARDRAQAIIDFASSRAVDLVAMSTHGRRGIGRVVAGSLAATVLRRAQGPMMLYRPEQ